MSNQYWNEQTQGFDRGIGNLGQAFMTIPRYAMMAKYRQQMLNTMGAREQAEGQESAARTALLTGQLAHLQSGDAAVNAAGKASADYMQNLQVYKDNPTKENLQALEDSTTSAAGALSVAQKNGDPQKLATTFQKIIALNSVAGGNVQQGANFQDPVSVANNAADNAEKAGRPVVAGNGSTVFTPAGQPLAMAASTLNPGQTRLAPQNNIASALTQVAQGQPMQPKSSAYDTAKAQLAKAIILQQGNTGNGTTNTISSALAQMQQLDPANPPAAAPAAQPASAPQGQIVTPQSQNEFDSLPSGALYVNPADGKTYRKK
ncbi:MAG: hypothetical protein KGL39_31295 [Patescibacteria group bacterium]|nr:hypothetical protein [Patescibacteria group bacterium]